MAKTASPPSPAARDEVLRVIAASDVPLTAATVVKLLLPPYQMAARFLTPILEEFAASGRLFRVAAATKTGKLRYWDRDLLAVRRATVDAALRDLPTPLTAGEIARRIAGPLKFTEAELMLQLEELAAGGALHAFPPKTPKGKARFWNRGPLEFARGAIMQAVATKGPQPAAKLKAAAKGAAAAEIDQALAELLESRRLWRHPPVGKKGKELYAGTPPSPDAYLRDLGRELMAIVAQLGAAQVPHEDVRRALVRLIETAGVSLGQAVRQDESPHGLAADIDLLVLMRRLEPGADRGALIGARELRRVANLSKEAFDRAALALSRAGRLSLHRHDYPASLTPAERDELVTDGAGTYYIGMAIRQSMG